MAITHARVVASGDRGMHEDWNDGHVIDPENIPRRAATLIVAANNSLDKDRADYVCDGANDDVQINQAIQALGPEGGMVLLLEGGYSISANIVIDKNYVTLAGMGAGTFFSLTGPFYVAQVDTAARVTLRDFHCLRNQGGSFGMQIKDSDNFLIFNIHIKGTSPGIEIKDSGKGRIIGNDLAGELIGIELDGSSENIVSDNHIVNDLIAIRITAGSDQNIINSNWGNRFIRIVDATCNHNLIHGNTMELATDDNGTNTLVADEMVY